MNNHWRGIARYARQKLVQTSPTDLETIFQVNKYIKNNRNYNRNDNNNGMIIYQN